MITEPSTVMMEPRMMIMSQQVAEVTSLVRKTMRILTSWGRNQATNLTSPFDQEILHTLNDRRVTI